MSPILVTGGTGTLGRHVVRYLLDRGQPVRVASRRRAPAGPQPHEWATVDYRGGTGLAAAVEGTSAVVHCATNAVRGEAELARTVLAAAKDAGCPHVVYISIAGVDRHPLPYYRGKLAAERVVADSGVGWTVLRATQFHDLVYRILSALARPPVLVLPQGVRVQPVDSGEVGARLAELATGAPSGRVPDFGGPEVRELSDLARAYLDTAGRARKIVSVPLAGRSYRAYRDGLHLAPGHAEGRVTFEEFLAQRR
ncbi:nucleoside-diphosphate sugar epimerase [Prauserella flavalba]|uniref:Nucleoside-diphosphate sugar epimerase n=1 Tax=Prauserella flavalba TaxID=1477506 RepID=A0A318LL91_9PSEU|nr:nucleoside-diphosphate sugar epimerase [Prauserella flavalba]